MADLRISELRPLTENQIVSADLFAVADLSATETRKITALDQAKATVRLIPDGTIPYGKIDPSTIDIPDGSVTADDLADDSVTHEKLADNAVETNNILDGAVTGPKIDPSAFNRGIDSTLGLIGITNAVLPGTHAGLTYNEQGLITGSTALIPASDLPVATTTDVGVVSVPVEGGLAITGIGAISIANNIAPSTQPKITYDQHGIVIGGAALEAADLPVATETAIGGVSVPTDGNLRVNDGAVRMLTSSVTPGSGYTKFACNEFGVITDATTLVSSDIPEISADNITSGMFPTDRLANNSVTAPKMADYSTCLMQEDFPGYSPDYYLGMLWWQPSTAQLRVYTRGSAGTQWSPVGFGALQANNLRWGGVFDASTGTVAVVTDFGTTAGLAAGAAIPAPSDELSGLYLICQKEGNAVNQPAVESINFTPGDWLLCINEQEGYIHIDAGSTGGGGGGGSSYLATLLDVELAGLQDGQRLQIDNTGIWRNSDVLDGGSF
jgi:hypothetical protein